MRARRFILPGLFLALGLWGCARLDRSPEREVVEEVVISDETPQQETAAEVDAVAAHNRMVIERAGKSLPDNAKDLIALIQKANEERLSESGDEQSSTMSETDRDAIPRVIAAGQKLREIASEEDRKSAAYDDAIGIWLLYRTVFTGSGEMDQLVADLKELLAASSSPTVEAAQAAVVLTDTFAMGDRPQALAICKSVVPILSKSDNEKVRSYATRLEALARNIDLVGHVLELKGTTVDGKPFDLTEMRGKVVLIDFWATWCHWCLVEVPNMKARYKQYHDRGFEIVSINVDNERSDLDEYLKANPVPWTVLYDGPWADSPLSTYYGVTGLPDLMLIDKDGKVLTNGWEGKEWRAKLAELFGDKDDEEQPAADDPTSETSDSDTVATDPDSDAPAAADPDKPADNSDKPAADSDKPADEDAKSSEAEAGEGK